MENVIPNNRIAIYTLPLHNNYGGVLQAFALQKYLNRQGFKTTILDKGELSKPLFALRLRIKYLLSLLPISNAIKRKYRNSYFSHINFVEFIKTHFGLIKHVSCINNDNVQSYDTIIVGSDQVWRKEYSKVLGDYYLSSITSKSIKKIAYAASIGEFTYSSEECNQISEWLKSFSSISCREADTLFHVINDFSTNSQLVVDPTLLLCREDYLKLIDSSMKYESDIVCYFMTDKQSKRHIVEKWCGDNKTECNDISIQNTQLGGIHKYSVKYWLSCIYNARFIVTDSFHAVVFSLIFHKQFAVIQGEGMGRIRSLLGDVDLLCRIVNTQNSINEIYDVIIDWNKVDNKLNKKKQDSINFLMKSI